jgi:hypothetical protein
MTIEAKIIIALSLVLFVIAAGGHTWLFINKVGIYETKGKK